MHTVFSRVECTCVCYLEILDVRSVPTTNKSDYWWCNSVLPVKWSFLPVSSRSKRKLTECRRRGFEYDNVATLDVLVLSGRGSRLKCKSLLSHFTWEEDLRVWWRATLPLCTGPAAGSRGCEARRREQRVCQWPRPRPSLCSSQLLSPHTLVLHSSPCPPSAVSYSLTLSSLPPSLLYIYMLLACHSEPCAPVTAKKFPASLSPSDYSLVHSSPRRPVLLDISIHFCFSLAPCPKYVIGLSRLATSLPLHSFQTVPASFKSFNFHPLYKLI